MSKMANNENVENVEYCMDIREDINFCIISISQLRIISNHKTNEIKNILKNILNNDNILNEELKIKLRSMNILLFKELHETMDYIFQMILNIRDEIQIKQKNEYSERIDSLSKYWDKANEEMKSIEKAMIFMLS